MECFFSIFLAIQPDQRLARVCKDKGSLALVLDNEKNPESMKLKGIWSSILDREELSLPTGGKDIIDGEEVIWHGEKKVTKKDKDYVWAIYDTLESEFGYHVQFEDFDDKSTQ